MEFSSKNTGLPFPTPGDHSDLVIEPILPESLVLACGFFITEPPGKPKIDLLGMRYLLQIILFLSILLVLM